MTLPITTDELDRRFTRGVNYGYKLGERATLRKMLNLMNAYDTNGQYEGSSADWQCLKDDVENMLKESEEADE